jgi:hypothetical protein
MPLRCRGHHHSLTDLTFYRSKHHCGLGLDIGPSEAETFWIEFLRKLARRGLRGVKLVISDAHEGLKAAITKVLHATSSALRQAETHS